MKLLIVLTSHDKLGDTGQNPASSANVVQALLKLLGGGDVIK